MQSWQKSFRTYDTTTEHHKLLHPIFLTRSKRMKILIFGLFLYYYDGSVFYNIIKQASTTEAVSIVKARKHFSRSGVLLGPIRMLVVALRNASTLLKRDAKRISRRWVKLKHVFGTDKKLRMTWFFEVGFKIEYTQHTHPQWVQRPCCLTQDIRSRGSTIHRNSAGRWALGCLECQHLLLYSWCNAYWSHAGTGTLANYVEWCVTTVEL